MQIETDLPETKRQKQHLEMQTWSGYVDEWKKSKESQRVFCERLGINHNTFIYVRSKLDKAKNKSRSAFIPITVKSDPIMNDASDRLTIENTKGIKLHFSFSMNEEKLIKLLKLMGLHSA